nr:hypothetical protein CFP56_69330 [Quercus suber]
MASAMATRRGIVCRTRLAAGQACDECGVAEENWTTPLCRCDTVQTTSRTHERECLATKERELFCLSSPPCPVPIFHTALRHRCHEQVHDPIHISEGCIRTKPWTSTINTLPYMCALLLRLQRLAKHLNMDMMDMYSAGAVQFSARGRDPYTWHSSSGSFSISHILQLSIIRDFRGILHHPLHNSPKDLSMRYRL